MERRELQLEEKKLILEIAIRVNDLRSGLPFLKKCDIISLIISIDDSRDGTKQLSLSPTRARSASQQDERDSGNGTSCSSGSGNEVNFPGDVNKQTLTI